MKRILGCLLSPLVLGIVIPQAQAADKLRIQAAFTVAFAAGPNTPPVSYCGGPALDFKVEAHGDGYSSVGALTFFLQKTIGPAGGGAIGHGCLTLTTPEGDNLFATYDLTQGQPNENNFVTDGKGKLAFTGGTGLFKGAKGQASFTAVFGDGIGFYVVNGKLSNVHGD
jgi:hypothetical protein